jgi:hypothetical protein
MNTPFGFNSQMQRSSTCRFELKLGHDAAAEFIRSMNPSTRHDELIAGLGGRGVSLFFKTAKARTAAHERALLHSAYAEGRRGAGLTDGRIVAV